jgi:coenzyme F420-reducing hydrogenase alpha subunit
LNAVCGTACEDAGRYRYFFNGLIDAAGLIADAAPAVPTGQDPANVEADMGEFVPRLLEQGLRKEEITLKLERFVRAHDPCLSWATRFLEVGLERAQGSPRGELGR